MPGMRLVWTICPFCGNSVLEESKQMLRPWGFAPRDAAPIADAQLVEEYSAVQQPLYSTLPDSDEMNNITGCKNIRIAARTNQRIIMMNRGPQNRGFIVCQDCGAAMPGDMPNVLDSVKRPYVSKFARGRCRHSNYINVNLGYDFVTDMLVLEFAIDESIIDVRRNANPWLSRAAQSLAEALRLAASDYLDVEFTELVTGYRLRTGINGAFVDIYLYDSLSSGAGYAVSIADDIDAILNIVRDLLTRCNCNDACHNCLKHYRNQYVHGALDRFAALDLLNWGVSGTVRADFTFDQQKKMIYPLHNILELSGCTIKYDTNNMIVSNGRRNKKLIIYPAMCIEPKEKDKLFVSDGYIKYAKPYAVQKIIDEL